MVGFEVGNDCCNNYTPIVSKMKVGNFPCGLLMLVLCVIINVAARQECVRIGTDADINLLWLHCYIAQSQQFYNVTM